MARLASDKRIATTKRIGDLYCSESSGILSKPPRASIPQVAVLDQHHVVQMDLTVQVMWQATWNRRAVQAAMASACQLTKRVPSSWTRQSQTIWPVFPTQVWCPQAHRLTIRVWLTMDKTTTLWTLHRVTEALIQRHAQPEFRMSKAPRMDRLLQLEAFRELVNSVRIWRICSALVKIRRDRVQSLAALLHLRWFKWIIQLLNPLHKQSADKRSMSNQSPVLAACLAQPDTISIHSPFRMTIRTRTKIPP